MSAHRVCRRDGRSSGFGQLGLRAVLGPLFVGHGLRKLTRRLGGPGPEGTTAQMDGLGLRPPRANAVAAGATQLAGGALVAAGLLTPVGATAVAANMMVVMRTSCAGRGPWGTDGGWEYPLVLTAAALALADGGPGPLSLDRRLCIERSGAGTATACLAASAAGSAAVLALARLAGGARANEGRLAD